MTEFGAGVDSALLCSTTAPCRIFPDGFQQTRSLANRRPQSKRVGHAANTDHLSFLHRRFPRVDFRNLKKVFHVEHRHVVHRIRERFSRAAMEIFRSGVVHRLGECRSISEPRNVPRGTVSLYQARNAVEAEV